MLIDLENLNFFDTAAIAVGINDGLRFFNRGDDFNFIS